MRAELVGAESDHDESASGPMKRLAAQNDRVDQRTVQSRVRLTSVGTALLEGAVGRAAQISRLSDTIRGYSCRSIGCGPLVSSPDSMKPMLRATPREPRLSG